MSTCSVDDCINKCSAKKLCKKHYARWKNYGHSGIQNKFICSTCDEEITYRKYFASQLCDKCYYKQYNLQNIEHLLKYRKKYYKNNKERIIHLGKSRYQQRYNSNVLFKIKVNLRNRLNIALKNDQKIGSAISDLGCSIEILKKRLESKFQPGMSWDNYGLKGWHIDHIVPLCRFNLTNRKELLKAVHYTNLQPLWACDNLSKGIN